MAGRRPRGSVGEIIRRQRERAEVPLRQLATNVGISGPYLSQIERGLRAPSQAVLESIAEALQTTADALLDAARDDFTDDASAVRAEPAVLVAVRDDPDLTAPQRAALAETYQAFVEANAARRRPRR